MSMLFIIIWIIFCVALPLFEKSDGTSLSYLTCCLGILGKLLAEDGNNHSGTNQSTKAFPRPHTGDQADLEPESSSLQAQTMKPALVRAQCSSACLSSWVVLPTGTSWSHACLRETISPFTIECQLLDLSNT